MSQIYDQLSANSEKNNSYKILTWDNTYDYCGSLTDSLNQNGYYPNIVIALARGGIVPARLFMDVYGKPVDFYVFDVKFYDGINKTKDVPLVKSWGGFFEIEYSSKDKKILIIDDIWDTGKTMHFVLNMLSGVYFFKNIKTMVLVSKLHGETTDLPNFCADFVKKDEWVVFPWEKYEFEREIKK